MQPHADNMGVDGEFDGLDYVYENAPNSASMNILYSERDLWCAVIAQAFFDMGAIVGATTPKEVGDNPTQDNDFTAAARWLLWDKKDFNHICDLAGVSPHVIRRAAYVFYSRCRANV